jgi:hypothetical protein
MKGIHYNLCTYNIYIEEGSRPIRQPQRRMNPTMKDIVKEELQKPLTTKFIYPIPIASGSPLLSWYRINTVNR